MICFAFLRRPIIRDEKVQIGDGRIHVITLLIREGPLGQRNGSLRIIRECLDEVAKRFDDAGRIASVRAYWERARLAEQQSNA